MDTYPHLKPGLGLTERTDLILHRIEKRGFRLDETNGAGLSWSNPLTKTIRIRSGSRRSWSGIDRFVTLAHEDRHAEQQGGRFAFRVWWLAKYLVFGILGAVLVAAAVPVGVWWHWSAGPVAAALGWALVFWSDSFRGAVEVEGEGSETAARLAATGRLELSHALGGFRFPYFLLGSRRKYSSRIDSEATRILDASRGGS